MNEYSEKQTVVRDVPGGRRPVVERQYDSVVERRPTSGVAIAALVIGAVAVAIVVTIMILNYQQNDRDQQLAQDRDRMAATQQQPAQPSQQAPIIIVPQQPGVPAPTPAQGQAAPVESSAPSSIDVEIAITSKLLDDLELASYPVDVKVKAGTATLSGTLPNEGLKARAEKVAKTVNGVRDVKNNIVVQP